MTDSTQDQSLFIETQEQLQAPPEIVAQQEQSNAPKRRKLWPALILCICFILLVLISITLKASQTDEVVSDIQTPTPTPTSRSSQTQEELDRLKIILEEADPNKPAFIPPPLDMKTSF